MSRLPETRRSVAQAVIACVLLALLVGCSPATPPEQPTVRTSVRMPAGEETVTTRAGFDQRMFTEWAEGRLRFTDVAAAQKKLPFALKMPDPSLVESPVTIYVREASKTAPAEGHVIFGPWPMDAVQLIAVRSRRKEDLAKRVAELNETNPGTFSASDKMWQLVDINGNQAMAVEPGVNKPPAPIRYRNRPGVVYWWDGDIHYVLNGTKGPDGTPLPELLAIARSLQ